MIREIQISATDSSERGYHEPPSKVLNVAVVGTEAFLTLHSFDETGKLGEELCAFQVRARSLLLALQAGVEDEQHLRSDPT